MVTAGAQASAPTPAPGAGSPVRAVGRLVHADAGGPAPVAGYWVTLHRVGPDSAAPVDSMRTGRDGRFAFTYRPWGSAEAVYFISATYDGIAYFSPPVGAAQPATGDAEITVFDTTSGSIPLHVRGRHLIVSAPDAQGLRQIIEVFELSNDSSLTRIVALAGAGDHPSWQSAIPASAQDFHGGQGDVSPDAIAAPAAERGTARRAEVFAPFAPGLKQLSYSYALPEAAFPLTIAIPDATAVFEVLVEETAARVAAAKLREVDPVSVSGHTFRRFLAQDLAAGDAVVIAIPRVVGGAARALYIGILSGVVALAMLASLAVAFLRRA